MLETSDFPELLSTEIIQGMRRAYLIKWASGTPHLGMKGVVLFWVPNYVDGSSSHYGHFIWVDGNALCLR